MVFRAQCHSRESRRRKDKCHECDERLQESNSSKREIYDSTHRQPKCLIIELESANKIVESEAQRLALLQELHGEVGKRASFEPDA